MRFRCWLLGCKLDDGSVCERCGVFVYDYPGIHECGALREVCPVKRTKQVAWEAV
jgi:hypothetical protein